MKEAKQLVALVVASVLFVKRRGAGEALATSAESSLDDAEAFVAAATKRYGQLFESMAKG